MLQALAKEVAEARGKEWCLLMWDLRKFYDSVGIAALSTSALRKGYPPRVLALLLMLYQGPRTVRSGAVLGGWAQPVDSILAGCGEANNMARTALYCLAEKVSLADPTAGVSFFVDDGKAFVEGDSEAEVVR